MAEKRGRKQVLLRLDLTVHEALARWATDELHSMSAQIEVVLCRALGDVGGETKAALARGHGRPRKDEDGTASRGRGSGGTRKGKGRVRPWSEEARVPLLGEGEGGIFPIG